MFSALAQRNMLNHTVVIFISDNAVARGAHRWNAKGCAYEECVHVPLLISMPGATPRTIAAPVSNVDLAPTIADLAGVTPTIPEDGESLVPLLDGTASDLNRSILLRCVPLPHGLHPPKCWAIRTHRWKYIETVRTGERELYDLSVDPYELANLDGQPAYAETEADLARRLDKLRGP
jgi:arylsulfatase A-like enzyme